MAAIIENFNEKVEVVATSLDEHADAYTEEADKLEEQAIECIEKAEVFDEAAKTIHQLAREWRQNKIDAKIKKQNEPIAQRVRSARSTRGQNSQYTKDYECEPPAKRQKTSSK